jgi:hypothetical protein
MSREEILNLEKHIDLMKGISGGSITLLSFITSHLPDIESWLRITSLLVGIAIGIATFRSITRKK